MKVHHSGQTGFPTATSIVVSQYDSRGNVLSQTSVLDGNSDGTIETRVEVANTYNSRGQLVTSITNVDDNGDGAFDLMTVTTVVYDGVQR
jgi:hypothetical protein